MVSLAGAFSAARQGGQMSVKRVLTWVCTLGLAACTGGQPTTEDSSAISQVPKSDNPYSLFESLQVSPLAISPSGKFLYALNPPDNRLEVFEIGKNGLRARASVTVGLEPVAVAARSN